LHAARGAVHEEEGLVRVEQRRRQLLGVLDDALQVGTIVEPLGGRHVVMKGPAAEDRPRAMVERPTALRPWTVNSSGDAAWNSSMPSRIGALDCSRRSRRGPCSAVGSHVRSSTCLLLALAVCATRPEGYGNGPGAHGGRPSPRRDAHQRGSRGCFRPAAVPRPRALNRGRRARSPGDERVLGTAPLQPRPDASCNDSCPRRRAPRARTSRPGGRTASAGGTWSPVGCFGVPAGSARLARPVPGLEGGHVERC
jgi:hypothetical protein